MQIAVLRGPVRLGVATGRARCRIDGRRQRRKQRIEVLHDVRLAADHLAEAALEPPDAAARARIHVVNAVRGQYLRAANVVDVMRVAAVDDDVALFEPV